MVMDFSARSVHFVMAGGGDAPDELSDALGVLPDSVTYEGRVRSASRRARPDKENSWRLVESGDSSVDIDVLLGNIYERLLPLADRIRTFRDDGWTVVVRVVQYLSGDDEKNPGFVLEEKMIGLLGRLGAFFEADLYVWDETDQ